MADSSLDSFFAKKDKSKRSKIKTKFTTSDTFAKKLDEGGKTDYVKKDIKEKISLTNHIHCAQFSNEQDDDEWKCIDDVKERDYTGLKIQALSISEKEKEDEQLKEQMIDQNGELCKAEGLSGPWKIQAAPVSHVDVEEEVTAFEKEMKEDTNVAINKTGAYKPPALRNVSAVTSSFSGPKRNPKSAPQITSEIHFPSLSSAAKGKNSDTDEYFQSVRHGARSKADTPNRLQLVLENKFLALHQGD